MNFRTSENLEYWLAEVNHGRKQIQRRENGDNPAGGGPTAGSAGGQSAWYQRPDNLELETAVRRHGHQ